MTSGKNAIVRLLLATKILNFQRSQIYNLPFIIYHIVASAVNYFCMKSVFRLLPHRSIPISVKVFLLAFALVAVSFLLQGNIGINLSDEGFLWYGTVRTALGEVPIRDFQSYDPGRYYWGAVWFKIFGNDGLISLRISTAIFQSLGLTFGLLSLKRVIQSWWLLTVAGLILLLWMYPNFYIFEPSMAMAAVYFAVLLIEKHSLIRHFIAGVFVGLSAFIGLNDALYTSVSFLLLIVFIWVKLDRNDLFRRAIAWSCGILAGYSSILVMLAIPDFFNSYVESIEFYFRTGETNLPLPVPFPWRIDYSKFNFIQDTSVFFKGIFFLILPIFNSSTIIYLLFLNCAKLRQKHLLIVATFVSLTYMHHAFSRADLEHLSAAIHPLLIGLISLASAFKFKSKKIKRKEIKLPSSSYQLEPGNERSIQPRWARFNKGLLFALLIATLFSVGTAHPFYLKATAAPGQYLKQNIINDSIWIDKDIANLIEKVKRINQQLVSQNEGFLIAPHWTTFYPILQRQSPLWDIYFLFPETKERQKQMIEELNKKNVNWVILGDVPLDGRDELRFKNTHPLIWQHLMQNFEVVEQTLPYNHQLLHRKTKAVAQ